MASQEEVFSRPLAVVDACFQGIAADEAHLASGHGWGVREAIEAAIARAGGLSALPALDVIPLEQLKPGTLVRFQGMVQDMWDPEYYLGIYEQRHCATGTIELKTGKYTDGVEAPDGYEILPPARGAPSSRPGGRSRVYARTPLHVVPAPGLSGWVADARRAECAAALARPADAAPARAKRSARDADADAAADDADDAMGGGGGGERADGAAHGDAGTAAMGAGKRTAAAAAPPSSAASEAPHPSACVGFAYAPARRSVVVKLYEESEDEASGPRVSELVEFVGILSLERDTPDGAAACALDDDLAHRPCATLVPRVHCVSWARLGGRPNPLLPQAQAADARAAALAQARAVAPALRAGALCALRGALGGDPVAAEYVLLWALSSVTARVGPDGGKTAVGALPLALAAPAPEASPQPAAAPAPTPPPPALASSLEVTLRALCPLVAALAVTIPALNARALTPSRALAGPSLLVESSLQLAAHSLLLLDESALSAGQLSAQGVHNLRALADSFGRQVVAYDFGCYTLDFETDAPALVLARGKPLIPTASQAIVTAACVLPVADICNDHAAAAAALDAAAALAPGGANALRAYLTLAAESAAELSDAVIAELQDDFVKARQADAAVGAEQLHLWCTLVRLRAQSELCARVSSEHWAAVKALEAERAGRTRARDSAPRGAGVLV